VLFLDDGTRHDGSTLALLAFGRAFCLLLEGLFLLFLLILLLFQFALLANTALLLLLDDAGRLLLAQPKRQQLALYPLLDVLE
jgi:hypothetical protein